MQKQQVPAEYLKIKDAAALVGMSYWTVKKWVDEGEIAVYRPTSEAQVKVEDLRKYMENHKVKNIRLKGVRLK